MEAFILNLAWLTAFCGWIDLQPIDGDLALTIDAFTIAPPGNAYNCCIYIPDFLDVPVNARQLQIDQQVSDRFFAAVADPAGKINIVLIVRLEQLRPYFLLQLAEAVV